MLLISGTIFLPKYREKGAKREQFPLEKIFDSKLWKNAPEGSPPPLTVIVIYEHSFRDVFQIKLLKNLEMSKEH